MRKESEYSDKMMDRLGGSHILGEEQPVVEPFGRFVLSSAVDVHSMFSTLDETRQEAHTASVI